MFPNIDLLLLDSPDFKEDSVREEIIVPIFKRLGFRASGTDRIVRSKALAHPFIYVGTRKHPVTIIPDYTLFHDNEAILVLDAKSPTEDILKQQHIQQAYSYSIHPEIKCKTFALCNGRNLAVFSVDHSEPLLVLAFEEFDKKWSEIEKYLSPRFLLTPELRTFEPDFGFKLVHVGFTKETKITMLGVRLSLFGRVSEDLYTASAECEFVGENHCVSFDFASSLLPAIVAGLPRPLSESFCNALARAPFQADAELAIELDVSVHLGEETKGVHEVFVPLIIEEVLASRFNYEPLANEPTDIPSYVFRLRKAFHIV